MCLMSSINLLTLFSGIGSPEQGAMRIYDNVNLISACEWDKYARQSFNANYKIEEKHFHKDICDMDGKQYKNKVDVLVGGSPCQDFSLAGLRAGIDGNKGVLIYEYIRIIEEVQPPIFIYENVKGMFSDKGGKTLKEFVEAFRNMGYHCHYEVVNTKDYGVPQNRERIFLVGFKDVEHYYNFSFAPKIKLIKKLSDMLESNIDKKYYLSDKMTKNIKMEDVSSNDIKVIGHSGSGGQKGFIYGTNGISPCLTATDYKQPKQIKEPKLVQIGMLDISNPLKGKTKYGWHFEQNVYSKNSNCTRSLMSSSGSDSRAKVIEPNGSAFCLRTNHPNGIIKDFKIRKLTPRECFRLQDFPDTFKFVVSNSQLYKQAGNSISVNVIEMIFKQIELSRNNNTKKDTLF